MVVVLKKEEKERAAKVGLPEGRVTAIGDRGKSLRRRKRQWKEPEEMWEKKER